MKKFGIIALGISMFATSCIKVAIDNSSTGTDNPSSSYNTKQEEIIATGIITGVINDGENVVLPKRKYTLKGYVYVNGRANLTFAPGTVVVSDTIQKGALIIERNSKLFAEGTATEPIVFTSGKPAGRRTPGDWGGIILLGNAPTNRTTPPIIEGGVNAEYGGSVAGDNSGSLKYVRIEFAGIAADPNSEINGLTLGGVGSGTQLNFIQTSYANDDAYEWFGGTVNAKNLVAFATADDDYDFDFGFSGRIQFAVSLRDPNFVDAGDAGNGVECDNDGSGSLATPFTRPVLSNFTLVGPNNQPSSNGSVLANHNFTMRWRRATRFSVNNSIFMCYNKAGLSFESDVTGQAYVDNNSLFRNNLLHAVANPYWIPLLSNGNPAVNASIINAAGMKTKAEADGTTTYAAYTDIKLTDPLKLNAPNFLPQAGSPALSGAVFTGTDFTGVAFWTQVAYRGAFGADNWMASWTSFTPQTNVY